MSIISYAQNHEDVILWRALSKVMHVDKGFYIDVGANDPNVMSVTKLFYDHGWRGMNMEPSEGYFDMLEAARPEDVNLRQAAGAKHDRLVFYEIPGTGLSTLDKCIADGHADKGWPVRAREIEVVTLAEVCEKYAQDRDIHFLKIDVEGGEKSVLQGMDFKRFRPWILVVEATLPSSKELSTDWAELVKAQGYCFTLFDGLNHYYVAEEKMAEMGEDISVSANIFDEYVPIDMVQLSQQRDALERELRMAKLDRDRFAAALRDLLAGREVLRSHAQAMQTGANALLDALDKLDLGRRLAKLCTARHQAGMIVYGAGAHLEDMMRWHPELAGRVARIFDKGKAGQKLPYCASAVESQAAMASLPPGTEVLISAIKYFEEISRELSALNPGLICRNIDEAWQEYV